MKPLATYRPSPLEVLIQESYLESEKIIETVRKHKFEANLYPGFKKVNDLIQSKEFNAIPNIVGTLLTTINDRLSHVEGKEKEILEFLSSELFSEQIRILNATEDGKRCWQKCLPVLKDTCEFKGYDFEALSRLLKFEYIRTLATEKSTPANSLPPYYEWLGSKQQLAELIRDLKDKQWIRSVNEFKKIFTPLSDVNYTFCAPAENKEKLLVLFAELKVNRLIEPKRNKGHFYPLCRYGVDLDKKLFQKEPKRYLENLKRKKDQYNRIVAEVQKLIRLNS